LGAACATSGGIALWHGEGVTPEAKEAEHHLQGLEKIIIDEKAIREAKEKFTCELSDPVVCIGCPHCSLREVAQVAKLVKGGKLRKRTMVLLIP
jgi:predicted aconitase